MRTGWLWVESKSNNKSNHRSFDSFRAYARNFAQDDTGLWLRGGSAVPPQRERARPDGLNPGMQAGPFGFAVLQKCLYAFTEVFCGVLVRVDLDGVFDLLVEPALGVHGEKALDLPHGLRAVLQKALSACIRGLHEFFSVDDLCDYAEVIRFLRSDEPAGYEQLTGDLFSDLAKEEGG